MNLAFAAAIGSLLLFVISQVQKRTKREHIWLNWLAKILAVVILVLATLYFYQRFFA